MKLPNDPNVHAGWGIINLDFLFADWAKDAIDWHDRVTTEGSTAQKAEITNERIREAFDDQLQCLSDKPRNGFRKLIARTTDGLMRWIQIYFYEGPE